MSEKDIVRVESALGCRLPVGYRNFLVRHTDEIERIKKALPTRAVLWTNANLIIRANRAEEIAAMAKAYGAEGPWSDETIVVGTNDGGDYWFVHRKRSPAGLWHWEHNSREVRRTHANFAAYVAQLRRDAKQPEFWR